MGPIGFECLLSKLSCSRGVMIPFFAGIRIGNKLLLNEMESESLGIDSKLELILRLESVPKLESATSVESIPVLH